MKSIYYFIILSVWAMLTVCCSSEELIQTPVKVGEEVQFGLSLDKETRTIYGDKNTEENAFPIYWVNGDKVNVYSPQCIEGRNFAEYEVSVKELNQNFADALTKTGESGLQWGETPANFYSIYPSGNYTIVGNEIQGLKIRSSQDVYLAADGKTLKNMSDCMMYAVAENCSVNPVNLTYRPIATSFMVNIELDDNKNGTSDKLIIQSVKLTASGKNIAGTFNANLLTGEVTGWENGENVVNVQISNSSTGGFYEMQEGDKVSIPIFIVLDAESESTKDWIIEIVTDKGTFEKTLNKKTTDGISNGLTLAPGKVHELTLPKLTINNSEWDVKNWMVNIPRNVYLSEVSIPGTWNSLNADFQSDLTIGGQYGKGVRAFHFDTRWRSDNNPLVGSSFTGITKPTITELSVAVGGSGKTNSYDGGNLMKKSAASTFSEYLKQITDNVKEDEYMIVFCTFAQNSYNGDRCPSTWYQAISDACASNGKVYDASKLTQNTLVGDVLNHVIVVVNLDTSVDSATLPAGSRCLFTYVPMQLPSNHYDATTNHIDALHYATKASSGISMYTSHAQISTTGTSYVNCGDRGYSHPLTSRDALVESFWNWSKNNYGTTNYNHDKWIYLGLGGYIMTSSSSSGSGYDTVEERYAQMVYNRIDEMGKNDMPYYPMGIILMNNKMNSNYTDNNNTDLGYDFSDVCKNILLLNNKYRLQYDEDKPANYNPNAKARSDYDGSLTSGGNAIQ